MFVEKPLSKPSLAECPAKPSSPSPAHTARTLSVIHALQAGIHMFVEKPLSAKPPEEVMELSRQLEQLQADKGIIVAVGYMLRYSPAVEVHARHSRPP